MLAWHSLTREMWNQQRIDLIFLLISKESKIICDGSHEYLFSFYRNWETWCFKKKKTYIERGILDKDITEDSWLAEKTANQIYSCCNFNE